MINHLVIVAMELKPAVPPGHTRRKLREFATEITRLRAEGYTIRAIHQALHDAGIEVGWATVQREVARLSAPASATPTRRQSSHRLSPVIEPQESDPPRAGMAAEVDSFFNSHAVNPLFRKKETNP